MKITSISPFCFALLFTFSMGTAQTVDTIITFKNKIPCEVKEVQLDAIKYINIGESHISTFPTIQVKKIVFKSGKVQSFSEEPLIKEVRYVIDYQSVAILKNEMDANGLKKCNEISATANYKGLEGNRKQALELLKLLAAFRGYDAVVKNFEESGTTQQLIASVIETNYWGEKVPTAIVAGIPFADSIPTLEDFKTKTGGKSEFNALRKYYLNVYTLENEKAFGKLKITNTFINNNSIILKGTLGIHDGDFKVIYMGSKYFVVHYVSELGREFNYVLNY